MRPVPDKVAGDGGAAVVLGHGPAELDVLGADLVDVHAAALAGHVQHVHVGAGLEGAGLAHQLDRVPARVPRAVSLHQAGVKYLHY